MTRVIYKDLVDLTSQPFYLLVSLFGESLTMSYDLIYVSMT